MQLLLQSLLFVLAMPILVWTRNRPYAPPGELAVGRRRAGERLRPLVSEVEARVARDVACDLAREGGVEAKGDCV